MRYPVVHENGTIYKRGSSVPRSMVFAMTVSILFLTVAGTAPVVDVCHREGTCPVGCSILAYSRILSNDSNDVHCVQSKGKCDETSSSNDLIHFHS